jgi:hypothetical protein
MNNATTQSMAGQPASILEALLEVGPRTASLAGLPANWCLAAAAMTRGVFADFGHPGVRVLGVRASVFNDAGWAQWLRNIPVSAWPDEAWSVGIRGTGRVSADSWDGHAVAYVPAKVGGGQAWLVDLSAPQMSRPDRGIDVPPVALRVDGSFYDGDMWSWKLPGAMLTMSAVPALTMSAHRQISAVSASIKCLTDLCSASIKADLEPALIA